MLNSAFSENTSVATASGERKIYTIVVEEADFVTIYWLLKWVYGNWLLFKEHDNPKAAIEGVGAGWSAKSLDPSGPTDEWAWRTLGKNASFESGQDLTSINDTRSVASAASVEPALSPPGKLPLGSGHPTPSAQSSSSSRPRAISSSTKGLQNSNSTRPPPSPTRRSTGAVATPGNPNLLAPMSNPASSSTSPHGSKTLPLPPLTTTSTFPSSPRYPISPNKQRQRSRASGTTEPDPHPHPTLAPLPASALAMYQVAHRYGMPGLASLSLEHMMSTITPQSSFALLLASSIWDELHTLVEVSHLLSHGCTLRLNFQE
ncbi:hypothetical protein PHLCEN_2v1588 [Hermanssonia centrifuga]|uniref:BTB domain-containing protein n=1 Tax=Hermanssonia centrifuga TaxID=98765 RepID=A0A2R6RZI9_9APHY|nr:hypothetical protein PHLCEN_2v1588 [Hermanssonia centrifuga]